MDKPKALGRWPNAPLAYLIAEIKFQRAHDFESRLPALIALLADDFPLEESSAIETVVEFPGGPSKTEILRDFKNFGSTMGVRLTGSSLALHCTDYAGWDGGFKNIWFRLLDSVTSVLRPRVLLRSSLRDVDILIPEGEKSTDDCLVPGLRPWTAGSEVLGGFEQGNIVSRFKQGEFSTTILLLSRIKGQILLPPTLAAMSLVLSPAQVQAAQFHQTTGRPFAIMDTDVAHEGARPFELTTLKAQFENIHRLSSASFKAATTPEAQKRWQEA